MRRLFSNFYPQNVLFIIMKVINVLLTTLLKILDFLSVNYYGPHLKRNTKCVSLCVCVLVCTC